MGIVDLHRCTDHRDADHSDVDRGRFLRRVAEFDNAINRWRLQGVRADQKRRELEQAQRRFIETFGWQADPRA